MIDIQASLEYLISYNLSDYYHALMKLDNPYLFMTLIVASIASGIYALYYVIKLPIMNLKVNKVFTSNIQHVELGIIYVASALSFLFWLFYHPIFKNIDNETGLFNIDAYVDHVYNDIMYTGLMYSFIFAIVFNMMFGGHVKSNIKSLLDCEEDEK